MENYKTIVALATPPGISGIAVIRLSGHEAIKIADSIFVGKVKLINTQSHRIHYGKILYDNTIIDTVTIAIYISPNSYTGEDVIEISCHGGYVLANRIIQILIEYGASQAQPGEFTKRAFINGKLDLMQVEAVADLIHSVSEQSTQYSARQLDGIFSENIKLLRNNLIDSVALLELELDFSEEDIEFVSKDAILNNIENAIKYSSELMSSYKSSEIFRSGFYVSIIGYPNSGKSTLFNTLLKRKRAIVSDIPGTTRDYLEEYFYINNLPVKLIDTAGIRDTDNIIEIEGIKIVESLLKQSNLIIILNDASLSYDNSNILLNRIKTTYADIPHILVHNKIDLSSSEAVPDSISISAKLCLNIDILISKIEEIASSNQSHTNDVLLNARHYNLLKQSTNDLQSAKAAILSGKENELISIDLWSAIKTLGELIGETFSDDVLNAIFSKFCIGK